MSSHPPVDPRHEGGPHPAVSLLLGFGIIILAAIAVHIVFGMVV